VNVAVVAGKLGKSSDAQDSMDFSLRSPISHRSQAEHRVSRAMSIDSRLFQKPTEVFRPKVCC